METFSWELTQGFPEPKTVIHYGHKQRDIIWAAPLLLVRGVSLRSRASLFHLGDLVLGPIAPLFKRMTGKPIVVTVHALELTYNNWGKRYHSLINWCLPSIDHFVAVSEYTAELLRGRGVPSSKITVIPHGVTPPAERDHTQAREQIARVYTLETNRPWLLTVGRLVRRKGVAWFVEHVLPQLTDLNPLYLIVSTGPDREHIEQIIRANQLEPYTRLLGSVSDEALQQLYAGADIFVMPNIPVDHDAEGFGFVAIEAAAAGLPVIASRLEGIHSAIHHGQNGMLIESGNATEYEQRIRNWITTPEHRTAFGRTARAYTLNTFSWSTIIKRYHDLFTQINSTHTP